MQIQTRLETYVNEVETRLRALPNIQRAEEIAEIRDHLTALAIAEQELGAEEEEAVAAALKRFGSAQQVSRGLLRSWRRRTIGRRGGLLTCAAAALFLYGIEAMNPLLNLFYTGLRHAYPLFYQQGWYSIPLAAAFVVPTALLLGFLLPRRAASGVFLVLLPLALYETWFESRHLFHWVDYIGLTAANVDFTSFCRAGNSIAAVWLGVIVAVLTARAAQKRVCRR